MADGLVDYHIETPDKIKSIYEGAGISTPSYNKLKLNNQQSIDTFKKAIAKAKQSLGNDGASVELKDDYTDINLYLSEDGESGFGIKPNGDIVSVFSSKKVKGRAHHLLEMAVYEGGGRQLDCFDIYLTKIYETHGFKPVAKMKWNDEYIPEGWKAKARMLRKDNFKDYNNGEPALTAGRRHNYIDKEDEDITEEEINNDIEYYIDSVKEYIDAKKKEFKEEDVNRDADGKFATQNAGRREKGASSNKSKDNDIEITDNDRYEYLANVYARMHGYEDNKLLDAEENAIRKNILGDKEKVKAIDNDIKYNRELEKSDKDKYNKYKEYKETAEYKEKMKKAINQFEGDTKATAEKLYSENLKAGELVLNKDGELDEAKINKLNIVEKGIHFFTEDCDNRNKKGFTSIKKKVKDLINKSIPKEISLYRHETIYESDERYNFEVGKTIKMDVRSFCNSENAFDSCRALQLWNNAPHKDVIFKIEGEVKSLEIESLSEYTNQKEHLVNGNFVITDIREATLTMPKIITIKVA